MLDDKVVKAHHDAREDLVKTAVSAANVIADKEMLENNLKVGMDVYSMGAGLASGNYVGGVIEGTKTVASAIGAGIDVAKKIDKQVTNADAFSEKYHKSGMTHEEYAVIQAEKEKHARRSMDAMRARIAAFKEQERLEKEGPINVEPEPEDDAEKNALDERRAAL